MSDWIDAYNEWVKKTYPEFNQPTKCPEWYGGNVDENALKVAIKLARCTGCYHYHGKFIRLAACPMHGSTSIKTGDAGG